MTRQGRATSPPRPAAYCLCTASDGRLLFTDCKPCAAYFPPLPSLPLLLAVPCAASLMAAQSCEHHLLPLLPHWPPRSCYLLPLAELAWPYALLPCAMLPPALSAAVPPDC